MTAMTHIPDFDPIRKSWRESPTFYSQWLKNGYNMTWAQRIGFGIISFVLFSSGLLFVTLAINSIRNGDLISIGTLGAICAIVAGLFLLVFGLLGLRNALRF
jgi:hypothetical protein